MKPRKPDETDAEYIARLEASVAHLKANNDTFKKDHNRLYRFIVPAAQQTGLVLDAAAELTGTADDPAVVAAKTGIMALGSCIWNDDAVTVPPLPQFPAPKVEYGGDVEMILKSSLEAVKQARPPWEGWRDIIPELADIDLASLDWDAIADEVFDAFADLEFSRGLLRLDMRSAMYDHCFSRIARALREAQSRVREGRPIPAEMPF